MAKSANSTTVVWKTINVTSAKAVKAKAELTAANQKAKDAREAFEAVVRGAMKGNIPDDKIVVFSHRFGKTSFAFVDPTEAKVAKTDNDAFTV